MRSLRLIRLQKAYRHSSRGDPIRDRRSGYHWSRSNWKREDGGVQFAYLAEFMGEATAVLRTCSSSDAVRRPHSRLDQMLTVRSELADLTAGDLAWLTSRCTNGGAGRRSRHDVPIYRVVKASSCTRRNTGKVDGSSGEHEGILAEGAEISRQSTGWMRRYNAYLE